MATHILVALCILCAGGATAVSDRYVQGPDPVPTIELAEWEAHPGEIDSTALWQGSDGWQPGGRTLIWDDETRIVWFRQRWTVPGAWAGRTLVLSVEVRNAQTVYVDEREVPAEHVLAAAAQGERTYRLAIRGDRVRRPGMIMRSTIRAFPAGYDRWLRARDRVAALAPGRGLVLDAWHVQREDDGQGLADPAIDHDAWPIRRLGEEWRERNACYWYRARVAVPDTIDGYPVAGRPLRLTASFNRRGSIWVDGVQKAEYARDFGDAIVADFPRPGTVHAFAIRVPAPATGWLRDTRLVPQPLADAIAAQARLAPEIDRWNRFLRLRPDARFVDAVTRALAPLEAVSTGDTTVGVAFARAYDALVALRGRLGDDAPFIALPYLQAPRPDGMVIRAESPFERQSVLRLVDPDGRETVLREPAPTRFHRHVLSGLAPGAAYTYTLTAGNVTAGPYTFRAAPADRCPVTLVAWGDSHYGAPILEGIARRIAEVKPDLAITAGDIVGDGYYEMEFIDHYLDPLRRIAPTIPVLSPVGNHDHGSWGARGSDRNPHLEARFDPIGEQPGDNPYSHSVDYGGVHVIFIDPQSGSADRGLAAGSSQYAWLESDLARSRDAWWTIVVVHEPPFCETWEGGYYDGERLLRRDLVPLMERYGVDLCISGHAHSYERGLPHPPYDPATGEGNTVAYLITGGGGSPLDNRKYHDWPQMDIPPHRIVPTEDYLKNDQGEYFRYHYCVLKADRHRLECTAYWVRTDGTIVDTLDTFILRNGIPRR